VRCNPRREPTVDDWQAERVAQIGLDADRRRDEHRSEGAAAIARIKGRGESIASIAALANISESEVRSYLKAATQALGGEQAEEHGGGSAPIGDAGDVDAPVV
jgi:DNA-directed RNA polymerase specialized sigma24 family protein